LINCDFDWIGFVRVPNDFIEQLMLLCDDIFWKLKGIYS